MTSNLLLNGSGTLKRLFLFQNRPRNQSAETNKEGDKKSLASASSDKKIDDGFQKLISEDNTIGESSIGVPQSDCLSEKGDMSELV